MNGHAWLETSALAVIDGKSGTPLLKGASLRLAAGGALTLLGESG